MAGHRKCQSLRDKLTPAQRERSKARVNELQKEMLLAELRNAHPDDAEACFFQHGEDLSSVTLGDGVGFNDRKRAFHLAHNLL